MKVKEIKAVGNSILVELLSQQEMAETNFILVEKDKKDSMGPPQGRILKMGPFVDYENYGIKEGDRVVLTGSFVPMPRVGNDKTKAIVDVTAIKAVLIED